MPAYMNGYRGLLIEAAAGLLDNASPETRIRAERKRKPAIAWRRSARSSGVHEPGSVTEILHLFRRGV